MCRLDNNNRNYSHGVMLNLVFLFSLPKWNFGWNSVAIINRLLVRAAWFIIAPPCFPCNWWSALCKLCVCVRSLRERCWLVVPILCRVVNLNTTWRLRLGWETIQTLLPWIFVTLLFQNWILMPHHRYIRDCRESACCETNWSWLELHFQCQIIYHHKADLHHKTTQHQL